jgi:hypothetical protein
VPQPQLVRLLVVPHVGFAAEDDDADPLVDGPYLGGEFGAVDAELAAHALVQDRHPHVGGLDQLDRLVFAVGVDDPVRHPRL